MLTRKEELTATILSGLVTGRKKISYKKQIDLVYKALSLAELLIDIIETEEKEGIKNEH